MNSKHNPKQSASRIIPVGTRVTIVSPESWDNGGWGIVKGFDGENYHVAMYGDENMQPIFTRAELRVPKRQQPKQAAEIPSKLS